MAETRPTMRVHSFLGENARAHFAAVAELAAHGVGYEAAPIDEPGLDRLPEIVAMPGPALLFLCGLPYTRLRDAGAPVEPIAASVPVGAPGAFYFTDLVVRAGLEAESASDLVGRRIGFNGRDSLSGYVLPYSALVSRALAAPLYENAIETGSHGLSLQALAAGELDAAAVDSTLLALEARADPTIAALRVLERLGPAPIPPVVLLHGDAHLAEQLRRVLVTLDQHAAGRRALELGLVERFVETSDGAYDAVREMDAAVR